MGVSDGQFLAEIQLIQLYGCYSQACRHQKKPGAASLLTMETAFQLLCSANGLGSQ